MDQVTKAIQQKYGVSAADSKKIVDVLVQVEKRKQARGSLGTKASLGESKRLLGDLAGGDDLMSLVGGLLGSTQQGSDLGNLVGGLLGGGQQGSESGNLVGGLLGRLQGRTDLLGIVNDLIGGGAGQGAGLAAIIGGLLVGQSNIDVMGVVNGLLGGSTPNRPEPRPQAPASTQTASDRLRQLGAAAKNKPLESDIGSDILDRGRKKKK